MSSNETKLSTFRLCIFFFWWTYVHLIATVYGQGPPTPNTEFGFHLSLKLICAAEKGGGHTEGKKGVPTLTTKKKGLFSCYAHHTDKKTGALRG